MNSVATTYTYKRTGDLEIGLDFYPAAGKEPAPLIVWIHGGALMFGTRRWMQPVQRQLLHEAGYAQASIDYRLAPESKLPDILSDVTDAFHWLGRKAKTLNVDATRIGVLGRSAGGYLALMSGCCLGLKPRAIASFYGYGDIIGDWYAKPDAHYCQQPLIAEADARATVGDTPLVESDGSERGNFYVYCRQQGLWPEAVLGINPNENPEAFTPYCPPKNITADHPPTLLLHGTEDNDVPYAQSEIMAKAFKEAGAVHELVTIDGGGHTFDNLVKPEDLEGGGHQRELAALYKVVQWFGKYL